MKVLTDNAGIEWCFTARQIKWLSYQNIWNQEKNSFWIRCEGLKHFLFYGYPVGKLHYWRPSNNTNFITQLPFPTDWHLEGEMHSSRVTWGQMGVPLGFQCRKEWLSVSRQTGHQAPSVLAPILGFSRQYGPWPLSGFCLLLCLFLNRFFNPL